MLDAWGKSASPGSSIMKGFIWLDLAPLISPLVGLSNYRCQSPEIFESYTMLSEFLQDALATQVEEFQWTVFSIVSISLVFIYSLSAAGDPRPPVPTKVRAHSYLAHAKQRRAEIAAAIELERQRILIRENWSTRGFRLKRLPAELQLMILSHCAEWPETYRSLVLVSRYMYHSTLRACLPIMSITLSSTKQLASFASLVRKGKTHRNLPDSVGNLVHRLWVSPLRREDLLNAYHILRACTNVHTLACDARGLAMITVSERFKHTQCKDLTLLGLSRPQWEYTLDTPSGLQLLRQLTHLRVMNEKIVPQSVVFDQLLYLSYQERREPNAGDDTNVERPWVLGDGSLFPSLRQVVLTRQCGPEEERAPLQVDQRLALLYVRRDRTEMEIWRNGLQGETLWQQAAKALPAQKKPVPTNTV
ncbi:hypothetical protein H0H92_005282 [Tricholoma furcatifolium]|nr:hypothetical protein H0H92_005282 [Tricholoma furcatifolium]